MNIFDFNSNINLFKQRQDENELAHYGTRGQKWGVRKWQNYDGTFNEAGKIRYFGTKSKKEKSSNTGKQLAHPDDPHDSLTVDRLNAIRKLYQDQENQKFGSYGPKKSDNPNNKYQNEDGTLTQKGYKKFVMSFLEDMDITTEDYAPSKEGKAKFSNEKFWEGETKRRVNLINDLLNDDSLDIDKELKSDIRNKNTRKNLKELIKYCKENGIDKVTDEMIEGVRAGQNYLGATDRLNNIRSQMEMFGYDSATIASYYAWLDIRNNTIRKDKNISKFKENNTNYKEYKKLDDEAMSKYNDTAQEKLIELLEKELGHKVPTKVYNPQNGTRALDMEKAMDDPEIMAILKSNYKSAADFANNDKSVIEAHTKAYKTLQKAEGDAKKYLENYLCSNAEKTVPGTTSVDLETGKVSESSLPDAMAYTLYADEFRKYEH